MFRSCNEILTTEDAEDIENLEFFSVSSMVEALVYSNAITSISTRTSFGSRATSTVERAGGAELKYLP